MPIRLAADPVQLYRIGRAPDPVAWPPVQFTGYGRYDDPESMTSTLYAAVERRAVFLETLDTFRPAPALLAQLPGHPADHSGIIAPDFLRRLIVRFGIAAGQRWLDVRSPETQETLRQTLAHEIAALGLGDRFVLGDLIAQDHDLTRIIASWARKNAFHGMAYASCHDPYLTCWAIFEGAQLRRFSEPLPVSPRDPDLLEVAQLWNLRIPSAGTRLGNPE